MLWNVYTHRGVHTRENTQGTVHSKSQRYTYQREYAMYSTKKSTYMIDIGRGIYTRKITQGKVHSTLAEVHIPERIRKEQYTVHSLRDAYQRDYAGYCTQYSK